MYDDEAEEEEVDRGEPGRFQQQGEGEHVLEVKEVIEKKGYEPCDMEKLVYLRNFEAHDGHTKYECKEINAKLKCFR